MAIDSKFRRSQLVSTYGPGSLLDLPKTSVIVGSLDGWNESDEKPINDPRFAKKIARILDKKYIELRLPPKSSEKPYPAKGGSGVKCYIFPEWFTTARLFNADGFSKYPYRILVNKNKTENKKASF